MMQRVASLVILAIVLALPVGLGATAAELALHLVPAGAPAQAAGIPRVSAHHDAYPRAEHHARPHVVVPSVAPTADRAAPDSPQRAVSPLAGDSLIGVAVTATPTRLAPLDTVTIAATFHNASVAMGPYVANLELLSHPGHLDYSATQSGFSLYHGQPLTLYWEWRTGTSLPPGTYTVRVMLSETAHPDQAVASGTANLPLTIVAR